MRVFISIVAIAAVAAGNAVIQEPSSHLQPPSDSQQDFNAPWSDQSSWVPIAEPQQPIHDSQAGSYEQYQDHNNNHIDQASPSVTVQVNHPNCATSFATVNNYAQWPIGDGHAPAVTTADHTEQVAPVVDYSNTVVQSNPWNNYYHAQAQNSYGSGHVQSAVPAVAKYIAITPGSIHIAPLPGHTVSQKIVNLAAAGGW
ncbi:uncharacterized protein LOC131428016 [Malaya genurostris]|uniref:uncharacterized protein LOC131428016 n=1 Tax=Malaya genurostris TaxID=325434 RepID=UPI0026F38B87|nr:uncharacterized protein LOC131428016 [Malaya genurostris]